MSPAFLIVLKCQFSCSLTPLSLKIRVNCKEIHLFNVVKQSNGGIIDSDSCSSAGLTDLS
jgi:hypothetical protein